MKNQNQKKNQETQQKLNDLGELTSQEINLLWRIRKVYRYGEIRIRLRDGGPVMIVQEVKYDALDI